MNTLHDPGLSPREAIDRALRETVRMQTDPTHPAGCLVALLAADSPMTDTSTAGLLLQQRRRNSAGIVACIRRAIWNGDLEADVDAPGLSAMIDATMAGLSLRARDGATRDELDRAIDILMRLWDAHGDPPSR